MSARKPNRKPNATCRECGQPFYAQPSIRRVTCSMKCRTAYYRRIGNLLTGAGRGSENPRWKGGCFIHQERYWLVLRPDHPAADRHGYVREHRLVMEGAIRRHLDPLEVVHHRDGDPKNNRLENLELWPSNAAHRRIAHGRGSLEETPSTRLPPWKADRPLGPR